MLSSPCAPLSHSPRADRGSHFRSYGISFRAPRALRPHLRAALSARGGWGRDVDLGQVAGTPSVMTSAHAGVQRHFIAMEGDDRRRSRPHPTAGGLLLYRSSAHSRSGAGWVVHTSGARVMTTWSSARKPIPVSDRPSMLRQSYRSDVRARVGARQQGFRCRAVHTLPQCAPPNPTITTIVTGARSPGTRGRGIRRQRTSRRA